MANVAKDLADYGEAFSGLSWLPVLGPWVAIAKGASSTLNTYLEKQKKDIGGRRSKLEVVLAKLNHPIVTVLDDVDRLCTSEIRDVFRLVRLTASFPNLIYIVAFDRSRVEAALGDDNLPGRAYLEKVLQVAIDLPEVPPHALDDEILAAIKRALTGIQNQGPFDGNAWPDIFMEIIRPLFRNMRDVRRYAAAIHGTVNALEGRLHFTTY